MKYYAIAWGKNIRWGGKHNNPINAMYEAYGCYAKEMVVHDLGTRKNEALKKFREIASKNT